MTSDEILEKAADAVISALSRQHQHRPLEIARAVLDAVMVDIKAEALLNLPVSLVEFVRASGRAQNLIARDAQITEKHLSRMLNHGEGSIDTWVRVLHAVRADRIAGDA